MRVVLDTNVLIAAFISRQGLPARVVGLWSGGDYDLVTSTWQIEEFRNASRYDRVERRVNYAEVGTFINALCRNAVVVENLPSVDLSPDPDDNYILATAFAGRAQYLVTGDKSDLQVLRKVQGIRIVTVCAFMEMFT